MRQIWRGRTCCDLSGAARRRGRRRNNSKNFCRVSEPEIGGSSGRVAEWPIFCGSHCESRNIRPGGLLCQRLLGLDYIHRLLLFYIVSLSFSVIFKIVNFFFLLLLLLFFFILFFFHKKIIKLNN